MLSSDSLTFLNKFTMILMQQISSQLKDTKSSHFAQEIFNLVSISWSISKEKLKLSSFASIRKHKKCSFYGILRSLDKGWEKWSNGLLKTKILKKVTNNLILGLMLQILSSEKRKNWPLWVSKKCVNFSQESKKSLNKICVWLASSKQKFWTHWFHFFNLELQRKDCKIIASNIATITSDRRRSILTIKISRRLNRCEKMKKSIRKWFDGCKRLLKMQKEEKTLKLVTLKSWSSM